MKKIFSLLAGITIGMSSFAQSANSGKISGSIKDGGNQKIIDAASVSLLKAKDSALVKVAVTDKAGNFSFENINDGNYLVLATSIGHVKTYSSAITISATNSAATVGVLQLIPSDKALKEVVVSSKKPLIDPQRHTILEAAHPSPLARDAFKGCNHFSMTNSILSNRGETPINWSLDE